MTVSLVPQGSFHHNKPCLFTTMESSNQSKSIAPLTCLESGHKESLRWGGVSLTRFNQGQ